MDTPTKEADWAYRLQEAKAKESIWKKQAAEVLEQECQHRRAAAAEARRQAEWQAMRQQVAESNSREAQWRQQAEAAQQQQLREAAHLAEEQEKTRKRERELHARLAAERQRAEDAEAALQNQKRVQEAEAREASRAQAAKAPTVRQSPENCTAPEQGRRTRQTPRRSPRQKQREAVEKRAAARQAEHRKALAAEEADTELRCQLRTKIVPQIQSRLRRYRSFISLLQTECKVRIKNCPSESDIHKAYVRALAKYHPDKFYQRPVHDQVEAEEMYKALGNAYATYKGT